MKYAFRLVGFALLPATLAVALPKNDGGIKARNTGPDVPALMPPTTTSTPTSTTSGAANSTTTFDGSMAGISTGPISGAVDVTMTIPGFDLHDGNRFQNGTATVYSTPAVPTISCHPDINDEFADANGNLVSHTIIPGNCPTATPVAVEKIEIEDHIANGNEIVDIEITPLHAAKNGTQGGSDGIASNSFGSSITGASNGVLPGPTNVV